MKSEWYAGSWFRSGLGLKVERTHGVFLQCGGDQPAALGATEVVAADVEALHMGGRPDNMSDVNGIIGCYRVVTEVDVGNILVPNHGGGGLFQPSLVDALE